YTNRLISETSPYLQKHAHNPVEWYPWGEEAFARARIENKPIHLSVGYTACHWCAVLEAESFEDEETAHLLNNSFINIKVDREERAQNDALMSAFVDLNPPAPAGDLQLTAAPIEGCRELLARTFDSRHGGFGGAPKFPHPKTIERLLRHWSASAHNTQPDQQA